MSGLTFKFLLIGNGNVGKTSLVRRLCRNEFDETIEATIGVEFLTKVVTVNDTEVKLQIWDTAGQERYRSVGKAYYRNSVGVLCVFSLTDHSSFQAAEMWFREVKHYCHPKAKIILVGNKSDLVDLRGVTTAEAEAFAKAHDVAYIESSAKDDTNVLESFLSVASEVHRAVMSNEIELSQPVCANIDDSDEDAEEKKSCC